MAFNLFSSSKKKPTGVRRINWLRIIVGLGALSFLIYRTIILITRPTYGSVFWLSFLNTGLIVGGMYALIAIGYTLVYGVMALINFAHGDIMMLGCFAGFFTFEALDAWQIGESNFMNTWPVLAIVIAFLVGTSASMLSGFFLEKIAYRPLRNSEKTEIRNQISRRTGTTKIKEKTIPAIQRKACKRNVVKRSDNEYS